MTKIKQTPELAEKETEISNKSKGIGSKKKKSRQNWKSHPDLKDWIEEDKNNKTRVFCQLCKCSIPSYPCYVIMHAKSRKHCKSTGVLIPKKGTKGKKKSASDTSPDKENNEHNNLLLENGGTAVVMEADDDLLMLANVKVEMRQDSFQDPNNTVIHTPKRQASNFSASTPNGVLQEKNDESVRRQPPNKSTENTLNEHNTVQDDNHIDDEEEIAQMETNTNREMLMNANSDISKEVREDRIKAETEYFRQKAFYFAKLTENLQTQQKMAKIQTRKMQLEVKKLRCELKDM